MTRLSFALAAETPPPAPTTGRPRREIQRPRIGADRRYDDWRHTGSRAHAAARRTPGDVPPPGREAAPRSQTVTIRVGRTSRIEFEVSDGSLNVGTRSPSWANVYVDDRFVGQTPIIGLALSPGLHRVRIEREGYRAVERTVRIEFGEQSSLTTIELPPVDGAP